MKPSHSTIIDLIVDRARLSPEKDAFVFLKNGEDQKDTVTFAEFKQRAEFLAARLQSEKNYAINKRALLLYQPGLNYIIAFFGCILAGIVPIPAYPPNTRSSSRLKHIQENAQPEFILTELSVYNKVFSLTVKDGTSEWQKNSGDEVIWLKHEEIFSSGENYQYEKVEVQPSMIAFLQYTSGSTGVPKGVEVSHYNLLHNGALTRQSQQSNPDCVMVSWLPPYHDMGLIGGIFQPLYTGMTGVLFSPMSFLKKPIRWLKTISSVQIEGDGFVISGAPNFAYEYCIKRVNEEDLSHLDLRNWKIAISGSEMILPSTVRNFIEKFKTADFPADAFCFAYGLAEATLVVTCNSPFSKPDIKVFDASALNGKKAVLSLEGDPDSVEIASCGFIEDGNSTYGDQKLVIIEPESKTLLENDTVGEICVSGASVAKGYFNNALLTEECFNFQVKGVEGESFLRTGDLGFIHNNKLYIQGRIKDLIIIRGRNYYPHDLETAINEIDTQRENNSVAFSIIKDGQEELIIAREIKRGGNDRDALRDIVLKIYRKIGADFSLKAFDVVLIGNSTIPKTTSGKVKRSKLKEMYLQEQLEPVISLRHEPELFATQYNIADTHHSEDPALLAGESL